MVDRNVNLDISATDRASGPLGRIDRQAQKLQETMEGFSGKNVASSFSAIARAAATGGRAIEREMAIMDEAIQKGERNLVASAKAAEKAYTALCWGQPVLDSGSIDLPLRYDPPTKPRHVVDFEHGKHALTFWRVLERCGDYCRVELTPITGRSHQLRVHMLSIGHPLLGDGLYAHEQALAAWPRLCLHASMLSLTHPQTGERLRFECPAPF